MGYSQQAAERGYQATRKNLLINGNFDIWQRGTSGGFGYTCVDRWQLAADGGGTFTVSRQAFSLGQTDVPGEPTYFTRVNCSVAQTGGTYNVFTQRVEDVRVTAGRTVTVSLWAKGNAGGEDFQCNLVQYFGSGGSPSSSVFNTIISSTSLTTSWQKFTGTVTMPSISGKTLGTNDNHSTTLDILGPINTTHQFDVAQVQVEISDHATDFEYRTFDEELSMCQRYYRKSFEYDTAPAQNAGVSGSTKVLSNASGYCWYNARFNPPMRATPTTTYYNPSAANTNWSNGSATSSNGSSSNIHLNSNTAGSNNAWSYLHWTCDAEL